MNTETLFKRSYGPLVGAALNQGFGRADAEELASEAFARLVAKRSTDTALLLTIRRDSAQER